MSNDAAVIGLTFDGVDIQRLDFSLFLEVVKGLNEGARVRGIDTVVPALGGRIARNRVSDGFIIGLEGYVSGNGTGETQQRKRFADRRAEVRALFDPTAAPVELVAELEDGTTLTCLARTLPSMIWDQIVPSMARLSMELESADADWTAQVVGS